MKSNLAEALRKLCRFDEARREIIRAIECNAQFGHAVWPWRTWAILAEIETDAGNHAAATEAKGKASACYLAYRRAGGENYHGSGRLVFDMNKKLRAKGLASANSFLQQLAADTNTTGGLGVFIHALQAIVAGSRDRVLAEAPELDYTMAAEILFLIETLENPR